jgi:hypothetical protein
MGSTNRTGRASVNPFDPRAFGICDRCGFLYNLAKLQYQYQWNGVALMNRGIKVCPTCHDEPSEFLRNIILPPDPLPVDQPRTEPYAIDEKNFYTLRPIIGQAHMFMAAASIACILTHSKQIAMSFAGTASIACVLTTGSNVSTLFAGTASIDVNLTRGQHAVAAITGTASFACVLSRGQHLAALFSATASITCELTQVTPSGDPEAIWTYSLATIGTGSYPGASIGTAAADRIVAVVIYSIMNTTTGLTDEVTAVTIDGVNATRAAYFPAANSIFGQPTGTPVEMWYLAVPTGTAEDIEITYTNAPSLAVIDVFAFYGCDTTTPFWDIQIGFGAAQTATATVDPPALSCTAAVGSMGLNDTTTSTTWTNATEDNDNSTDFGGLVITQSSASRQDTSAPGSTTIQAVVGSNNTLTQALLQAFVATADPGDKWIVATSTNASFPVPADWNDSDNSIHAIGSSANAVDPVNVGGGGTGGGAWARTDNVNLAAGGTCNVVIGSNGSDTYLSNTGSAPTSTSEGVLAKGGAANSGITGGAGGASGSCIGTAANSGGAGGNGTNALNSGGGGGGGAAGPLGVGRNGGNAGTSGAGGGGAACGGAVGSNGSTTSGGGGGASFGGYPGGTGGSAGGGVGFHGAGGGGKGNTAGTGVTAAGSMFDQWVNPADGVRYGPGSGGGGGRGGGASNASATGGQGGLYGGGAGGSGEDATVHQSGRPGLVIIRYRP